MIKPSEYHWSLMRGSRHRRSGMGRKKSPYKNRQLEVLSGSSIRMAISGSHQAGPVA